MSITIGSNIASLMAQRKLGESSESLSKTYERLSSGLRINRPSDDAAGLAVSSTLNASAKVLAQAMRNVNDGISLVSIADSAIGALTDITTRIVELTAQSANGTYTNKQREALDKEAQELAKEYFRISRTTQFNGLNIFDGSIQGLSLQAGFGTEGMIQSSLGGKLGTGNFNAAAESVTGTNPHTVALGDLNADGILDMVTGNVGDETVSVLLGNGDGSFKAKTDLATGLNPWSVALGDVNGDGFFDIVTGNEAAASVSVLLGNGDGTFKAKADFATGTVPYAVALGDLNGDGALDIVSTYATGVSVSVLLGNGDGTFKARSDFASGTLPRDVTLGDLNGDGILDIVSANSLSNTASVLLGNGDGTFKAKSDYATGFNPYTVALGDLNGDGKLDIVSADSGSDTASVLLGNGDGTFNTRTAFTTGDGPLSVALGDLNGDGKLDIVSVDAAANTASVLLGNGNGTFQTRSVLGMVNGPYSVTLGDLNGDGVQDIVSANSAGSSASVLLARARDGVSPILPFSLRTKADALQAMGPLKRTLEGLGTQRGILGAFESRLSSATALLGATVENYRAAESRIRDADVAQESANLIRQQILQQVGAAILGQANQQPQIALSLLKNF